MSERSLRRALKREFADKEYRDAYCDSSTFCFIASQMKVIREQRGMTQEELAELIGTQQPGVARIENINYENWTVRTLLKLAHAFDVRLKVSFEETSSIFQEVEAFSRKHLERNPYSRLRSESHKESQQ